MGPVGRPLEDKPTKQRWIDGAGYDVTSANNKRNHLRWTWSNHMIDMERTEEIWQWHAHCTQANLCDNCICCISSIWLKVATAVSNHEMHVTFSFCCDFSILFNFKWQGLHFFYSLESCHGSFQLWEALFGPPSHMPERTKLTNIHIWCGIVRLL